MRRSSKSSATLATFAKALSLSTLRDKPRKTQFMSEIIAMNEPEVETNDPSLELELYQAKHIVNSCVADPKGFATDLYSALCNTTWVHRGTGSEFSCSWRYAGGIVSTMSHSMDDHTIYYGTGAEGTVTDEILTELDKLGWEPTEEKDEQTR